jgi:hypothetical protein
VVAAGLSEILEERIGAHEDHAVAGSDGGGAECLDQEGFADADGSNQDDVFLALEELQRKDVLELLTIDVHGRAPIEGIERDALFKAGQIQVTFERLLLAALDFVSQKEGQERGIIEVLGARQRQALRQRRYELTQLQAFEQTHEVRIEAHDGSSPVGVMLPTTGR